MQYLCEHALDPFDDCYCRKVTGRHIPNIAQYCMGRYSECPIYQDWLLIKLNNEQEVKK